MTGARGGNGGIGGVSAGTSGEIPAAPAAISVNGTGNTVIASGTIAPGAGPPPMPSTSGVATNILDLTAATVNGSVRMTAAWQHAARHGHDQRQRADQRGHHRARAFDRDHQLVFDIRGGTYNAEMDAAAVTADLFNVTGPSVAPGGSAWITGATVNISNLAGTPAGPDLHSADGRTCGVSGTFTLGTLPAGVSASLSYPGGTSVVLTITAVAAPVPAGPASIPTLSEWGLATLSLLVAGACCGIAGGGRV